MRNACRATTVFFLLVISYHTDAQEKPTPGIPTSVTVEFFFSASPKNAGSSAQITAGDISVLDEGSQIPSIELKGLGNSPVALGILLDGSPQGRTVYAGGPTVAEEEKVISNFAKTAVGDRDKILPIRFAVGAPSLAGVINLSEQAEMRHVVDAGQNPHAGVDLFQAVAAYQGELGNDRGVRKAVLIIANGGTFLGPELYKQIVETALRDKIVLSVCDAYPGPGRYGPRGPTDAMMPRTDLPEQVIRLANSVKQSLRDLATDTGGFYQEGGLRNALLLLQQQMNSQYMVTYSSSASAGQQTRKFHSVRIRSTNGSFAIQAPKGYYPSN